MKLLFIEPYPTEGPSSRYRVEQYVPYFEDKGIKCIVRPFVSSEFYKIIYKRGFYGRKFLFFLQSCVKRFFDIFTALSSDMIFVHLEAFPFGPALWETILYIAGKKIIYDLDDAIYMGNTSPVNKFLKCLKCPSKVKKILKMSNRVVTCNAYLAEYAARYNKNVTVIPTSVDTHKFMPLAKDNKQNITIGWIGSHSTVRYLKELKDVFRSLALRHAFSLKIVGASSFDINIDNVDVIKLDWTLEDEIEHFRSLDIGVYPLADNEWTLGKTGFKTIQYMSVGIPCVVSYVGTNKQIVRDGVNGYLAKTKEEWVEKLSTLIKDSHLRAEMGIEGRKTVEEKFSLTANLPKYLQIIESLRACGLKDNK